MAAPSSGFGRDNAVNQSRYSESSSPWAITLPDSRFARSDQSTSSQSNRYNAVDSQARPGPSVFQPPATQDQYPVQPRDRGLDHDDLLGPQRDNTSQYTSSAGSPTDPEQRRRHGSTTDSYAGSSPPSSRPSEGPRSFGPSSPPFSEGRSSSNLSHDAERSNTSARSSLDQGKSDNRPSSRPQLVHHRSQTSSIDDSTLHGSNSTLVGGAPSPLSPLVEPFSPSAAERQASRAYAEPPSGSAYYQAPPMAPIADEYPQGGGYRTGSSASSSQSAITAHSLYNHGVDGQRKEFSPAELSAARSLTSAAFASLGAQLGLTDGLSFANRASQDGHSSQGQLNEEISTIFVIGFPEDMQEREFQNMFIFSPGFEAATLKSPKTGPTSSSSGGSRDGHGRTGIAGSPYGISSPTMTSAYDNFQQSGPPSNYSYEDDSHGNSAQPPSLAQFLSQGGNPREGNTPSSLRKQIIGFAKFRSRQEALDARDVLSGRRVDADKDCVLKAEMAKKNLHTKRGLDNGLTKDEIVAAITHVAFYAGWPTAMTGLQGLREVLKSQ